MSKTVTINVPEKTEASKGFDWRYDFVTNLSEDEKRVNLPKCPYCDSSALHVEETLERRPNFRIVCAHCDAMGPPSRHPGHAAYLYAKGAHRPGTVDSGLAVVSDKSYVDFLFESENVI